MGGDLNLKKSWHPGLLKNQERVWLQEKRALEERKQITKLQREREEERQMEEIQRLQEASGNTKQHRRVDWMYQAPSTASGHYSEEMDGYLLGKRRIDGVLLKNDPDTKKLEKGSELVGNGVAAGPSIGSARDTMSKVMADPLLEVKKREQAAYEAMVKETLRRKEREKERGDRDRGKDLMMLVMTAVTATTEDLHLDDTDLDLDHPFRLIDLRADTEVTVIVNVVTTNTAQTTVIGEATITDPAGTIGTGAETVATTKTSETGALTLADTKIAKTEVDETAHQPGIPDLLVHLVIAENAPPLTKIAAATSPARIQ
ncbi:hypothetical protein N7516_006243 [Penicillium verrucosum]|uniref:uncharacterized protein n=1 Tax=Penicillium verrucosum TaxID=60171 RepID=UPI002544E03F|nr:uncharacterized protein N7516_006243 [Penicillium verrucosum]KAJ5931754.1 hypothetical protein N7516_006243 [Penicillium verrucosum]